MGGHPNLNHNNPLKIKIIRALKENSTIKCPFNVSKNLIRNVHVFFSWILRELGEYVYGITQVCACENKVNKTVHKTTIAPSITQELASSQGKLVISSIENSVSFVPKSPH